MSLTNTSRVTRRVTGAAAAVTLALSLGACSSSNGASQASSENQATELTVGAAPSLSGLGLQAAISQGEFSERGLNVTAVANKSANDAVPQLLSGELQVAQVDTLTLMQARNQGLPVKVIAANGEQSTNGEDGEMSAASIVAESGGSIDSVTDLVGQKVGVSAIKTQTWMNIRAMVDEAGGDSSKIEFLEVPPPQMVDLVQQGEVVAATPNEPLASSAIAAGTVELVHNTDAPGNKGVPSSVYVATEEFIAQNPDTVEKFAESVQEAASEINDNRDLAMEIALENLDFTPEQLETAFFQTFGTDAITPEEIDKIADLALRYEILSEKPQAEELLADIG